MGRPVLVLGGGLMGLAVAHSLARRGRTVRVLSRRRSEAAGFVAAGMLAPHAEGLQGSLLHLGQAALARIPEWVAAVEADSGLSCGLRPCGIVVPFSDAAERDAFPTAAWGEPLERDALEREVPGLAPRWRSGLLFHADGQIDNRRRLMRALERACVQRGVAFEEGAEVRELLQRGGRLEAVRLRGADGEERELAADQAVLCSGAWSGRLLPALPVFPVKGQMLSLQAPRQALARVLFGPGTYLVPRQDGLVVVGATGGAGAGVMTGHSKAAKPPAMNSAQAARIPSIHCGGWSTTGRFGVSPMRSVSGMGSVPGTGSGAGGSARSTSRTARVQCSSSARSVGSVPSRSRRASSARRGFSPRLSRAVARVSMSASADGGREPGSG